MTPYRPGDIRLEHSAKERRRYIQGATYIYPLGWRWIEVVVGGKALSFSLGGEFHALSQSGNGGVSCECIDREEEAGKRG
jgi:hypothetical protein